VRVGINRTHATIELLVSDSGPGIARDFLPFVFDAFRQADGSTTRRQGGLGLGLAIVKHLVDAHGGSVKAESGGEGRGATFIVRLPVVAIGASASEASAARIAAQPVPRAEEPIASLDGLSVLVVDDDEESRTIVAEYLERQRATVMTAASAAQALGVLEHQHIDVLLADIAMPDEDGYSLIKKVRASEVAETAAIPAAALTSFARQEDRQTALQAGFHLHLAKPIDPRRLIEAVARLGAGSAVSLARSAPLAHARG
jgi:CheY-like chemotaxis protein